MYHTIVASIARKNFELVNTKDYDALLQSCDPNIHHRFGGQHALGGERTGVTVFRKWLERLGRLSPAMVITARDVWVKGWPWDTTIIVRWTNVDQDDPDGTPYRNRGVHVIKMRWFKVVDIDANEDSQIVAESLARKKAAGWEEAGLPPVTS